MSNEAETLIERARALPPEDRIALVEDVLASDTDHDFRWRSQPVSGVAPAGAAHHRPTALWRASRASSKMRFTGPSAWTNSSCSPSGPLQ